MIEGYPGTVSLIAGTALACVAHKRAKREEKYNALQDPSSIVS
jgi:hypothetical protein